MRERKGEIERCWERKGESGRKSELARGSVRGRERENEIERQKERDGARWCV